MNKMLRGDASLLAACTAALIGLPFVWAAAPGGKKIDFDRDVRPILSDRCFTCHGPDEKKRMVDLRLDTKEGLFANRGGTAVVIPGDAKNSRLYQRISHEKRPLQMPPPVAGEPLTDKQIETIRRWINEGAEWEMHWAYVAPKRPELPEVQNKSWPRNPIDYFVLARLEQEGLKPSVEADKPTMLRRLSLDLTGLPPALEELDAFLSDRSPDAYEKQVDRLLASPRYGERMAMEWLDLARYADTHGYHIDSHRDMWHWRDWVVNAFNRNLPYDRFTIEQLAGDLLPSPTPEQLIATGFNRNHMINFEGGAIEEEYLVEYVVDRVETTSNVWLGTTMGCARCHDHKYDPIKQRDFYRMFAFFNTVDEEGLDGRRGNAEPVLQLPSPEQKAQLNALEAEIEAKEKAFPEEEVARLQAKWEQTRLETMPKPSTEGLVAHYEMEGSLVDTSGGYRHGRKVRGEVTFGGGKVGKSASFSGEAHFQFGDAGDFDGASPFAIALWVNTSGKQSQIVFQKLDESDSRRGYELEFSDFEPLPDLKRGQHGTFRMIHQWPEQVLQIRTKELVVQEWRHVAINYDGSGKAQGLTLYIDGEPVEVAVVKDNLGGPIRTPSPFELGSKRTGNPTKGRIDDLRFYARQLAVGEIEHLAIHEPVRAILAGVTPRPKKESALEEFERDLRDYFLRYDAPEGLRSQYIELEDLRARCKELVKHIPTTMVMQGMEEPRETFILGRGDYRNRGDKVAPGVPSFLPPMPADAPANRLGLAKWLVDPSHPLTARVAANRFWQIYFGTGLVKTAEDFGSQGEPPSHPELLDWLATEFIRSGWDVKAMQRLIVTSAAYRQSSRVSPELLERDPENRLFARGPRFRLKAEIVRDNALAIGALLNGEMGGPSVFPYQPPGLWEDVAYGDVYSAQAYTPSHGKDLYRRSMYTFWKRTASPPSLVTFDAPDREKCIARRARTNTPLQALVLLNDPTFVEAARALAQRMLEEAGHSPGERINYGFRLATARRPDSKERQVLRDLAERQLAHYRRSSEDAQGLLGVGESKYDSRLDAGELAAWTTVAGVILNLDEVITKQ